MRALIFILLLVLISCDRANERTSQPKRVDLSKISLISFELENALRIPNHKISIEIAKRYNGIFLHVTSNPIEGHQEWEKTKLDTNYIIDSALFNKVLTSIRKISSEDLESSLLTGDDGTSCEIKYGNYQNSISI